MIPKLSDINWSSEFRCGNTPTGVTCWENLDLSEWPETSVIPDDLTVNGSVDLQSSIKPKFPHNFYITGTLDLSYTRGVHITNNVTCLGTILLHEVHGVNIVRESITGSLVLQSCNTVDFPDSLTVSYNLTITNTGVKNLPKKLSVGTNFFIESIGNPELPEGIDVGQCLYICDTNTTSLPAGLTVGATISMHSDIDLPIDIVVGGNVYLGNTLYYNTCTKPKPAGVSGVVYRSIGTGGR